MYVIDIISAPASKNYIIKRKVLVILLAFGVDAALLMMLKEFDYVISILRG